MRTAEDIFGVSSKSLDTDLAAFYKEAERLIVKNNPLMANELKYYSRLPLHLVPYRERAALIRQYRKAISLDDTLLGLSSSSAGEVPGIGTGVKPKHQQRVANIFSKLKTGMGADSDQAFGRLPTEDMGGSRLSKIYSSLNIQFRQRLQYDRAGLTGFSDDAATAASYFTIGLNSIPTENSGTTSKYVPGKNMLDGKTTMVYDIETAGLSKGQIREVSYSRGGVDSQILFNPKEFERGLVNIDGESGTLSDFLRKKHGLDIPTSASGDDFARRMRPFLESVVGTDFIVGHNITGFDNEQVFVGLSRTNLYKNDSAYRELVDQAFDKVKSSSIDTLEIARQMPSLAALQTADELADHSVYSIQNLLLKTDLAEKIGIKKLHGMVNATGLHHANIDVAVTSAILDAAEGGGLQVKDLGSGLGEGLGVLARELKEQILSSSAITPGTNISSVDQLTDDVLAKLVDTYRFNESSGLMAESGSELDSMLRGDVGQRAQAFKGLRDKTLTPQSIRLTPIEQQIISERDLARTGIGGDASLIDRASSRIKIKNAKGIRSVQRFSREAGIPFAGLSGDERTLARGFSVATSALSGLSQNESQIASLASDTLVSRFGMFDSEGVQYVSRSGKVSLPQGIVKEAGLLKSHDLVSLSVVDPTEANPGGAINVVKNLNEDEASGLKSFLSDLLETDDDNIARVLGNGDESVGAAGVKNFREAMKGGLLDSIKAGDVSVAQVHGGSDRTAVQTITDLFRRQFNMEGQLRDDRLATIALPVMNVDHEEGVVRTSGALLNKGMGREERRSVRAATSATDRVYRRYLRAPAEQATDLRIAQRIAQVSDSIGSDTVRKIYASVQNTIIPNLGKGALGAVAIGAGALLLGRHKENQRLNETMDFQGWESSAEGQYGINQQLQERVDMGYDGYSNLMDPLATASVVNNLNNASTGHSNYDWARNNQLYGGLL